MRKLIFLFSLLLFSPLAASSDPGLFPRYNLSVTIDAPASRLTGTVELNVEPGANLLFSTAGLAIDGVTLNGAPILYKATADALTVGSNASGQLAVHYSAVFKKKSSSSTETNEQPSNVIDEQAVSLTERWYPRLEGLAGYQLRATLPPGFEAVSEAEDIDKQVQAAGIVQFTFHFDHPLPGISLIASNRFEISREKSEAVELYAYFYREDRDRARAYLNHAKKYIALYEKMLGKYPYRRLSIVESIMPAGYSTPGATILGRDVLRLPSIPETSLGHEILHQWFGGSVYADLAKGNWTEGLTTYLADHLYEEQAGKGREYRKQLLLDYAASVNRENEVSLREFKGAADRASKAIGYNKSAMVFHMLKKLVGDESFFEGLRTFIAENRFRQASWDDMRTALEKRSGKNLRTFFEQWIDRKGLPELNIENGSLVRKGDQFEIKFDIEQSERPFVLDVPVVISAADGSEDKHSARIDSQKRTITLSTTKEPRMLALDREYDVARKPGADETPPQVVSLLADRHIVVVPPLSENDAYQKLITAFKEQGAAEKQPESVTKETLHSSSVIVLGQNNPVITGEFGRIDPIQAGFSLVVKRNPWNKQKVIAVITARSAEEADKAFPQVSHYGKSSAIAFDQGKAVLQKTEKSDQGVLMELREPATVIDLSTLKTVSTIIDDAADKKIVYAGEFHDKYAHHAVQLDIIEKLYQKNQKLAIGMEMFQRPFQKIVDEYISGTIDERAFLKGTEYFKRWVYDYNLYKPILDFARSRRIPVVALNQSKEITDKVSKSGIDSLSVEERKLVPQQLDFSDNEYRERLKGIFDQHKSPGRNFDFFYQAQVLWDETMALSIDEYLRKNPDYRMVVIAGGGHLTYGSGIPRRAFRRNGLPYSIALNDSDVDRNIGNFVILPPPLEGTAAPKLMASLKEEQNRIIVTDLVDESPAKKAGIKAGDTILSMDNQNVQGVEDIKLILFYKQHGDVVKMRVERKGFFGSSQIDFDVTL